MALIDCPECWNKVSQGAETCPHCGFPIRDLTNKDIKNIQKYKKRRARKSWLVVILIFILISWFALSKEAEKESQPIQESTVTEEAIIEETPIEYPTDVMVMTLDEIEEGCPYDYMNDAVYMDRYVQFTGEIVKLEQSTTAELDGFELIEKEYWIVCFEKEPNDNSALQVFITCSVKVPEEYAKLQNYKIGDTITITGKCYHALMKKVMFENCFINYNISE